VVFPLFGAGVHVIVAVPLPAERAAVASLKTKIPPITTATTTTAPTDQIVMDRRRCFGGRIKSAGGTTEPFADPGPAAGSTSGAPLSALTCSPIVGAASERV